MRGLQFELGRITIEASTPFQVGSGRGDDTRDAVFVMDASGLPTIPGTTLAGILRHRLDPTTANTAFGYQDGTEGASSLVELSYAQVHGSKNVPTKFLLGAPPHDPVLAFLTAGLTRDHVRIDARGVVGERGKFDQTLVPAGARFTFEVLIHQGAGLSVAEVASLIPHLRVGGSTRRGYGAFKVISARGRTFDLRDASHRQAFLKLPRALHEAEPTGVLPPLKLEPSTGGLTTAELTLDALDHWIFGGGVPSLEDHRKAKEEWHDRVPVTERRVEWDASGGKLSKDLLHLIPGSSVKGALRHRAAFHARRIQGQWAGGNEPTETGEDVEPVVELFGRVKSQSGASGPEDRAGSVWIDDVYLDTATYGTLDHVSLDRFTQGPLDGHLFGEAVLHRGRLKLKLTINTAGVEDVAKRALAASLDDLREGRLALGAGANRGHGYFKGTVTWSDGGRWIGARG